MARQLARAPLDTLLQTLKSNFSLITLKAIYSHKQLEGRQAKELLTQIREDGNLSMQVYSYYLTYFAHKGDAQEVQKGMLQAIQDSIESDDSWNAIMAQLLSFLKQESEALDIIFGGRRFKNNGQFLLDTDQFIYCMNHLGTKIETINKFAKLWTKMRNKGVAADKVVSGLLVRKYCQCGDFENAFKWMDEIKREGLSANAGTYSIVINELGKKGQGEEAERWLEEARREGHELDNFTYSFFLSSLCKSGHLQLAIKWLGIMKEENRKILIEGYRVIISSLARIGNVESAEMVVKIMKEEEGYKLDIMDYLILIDAYLKKGELEKAEEKCKRW